MCWYCNKFDRTYSTGMMFQLRCDHPCMDLYLCVRICVNIYSVQQKCMRNKHTWCICNVFHIIDNFDAPGVAELNRCPITIFIWQMFSSHYSWHPPYCIMKTRNSGSHSVVRQYTHPGLVPTSPNQPRLIPWIYLNILYLVKFKLRVIWYELLSLKLRHEKHMEIYANVWFCREICECLTRYWSLFICITLRMHANWFHRNTPDH